MEMYKKSILVSFASATKFGKLSIVINYKIYTILKLRKFITKFNLISISRKQ